jgi:putative oxidoreductase
MNLMSWSPRLLSVLRIVSALLFVEHGTQKVLGFPPPAPMHGPPPSDALMSFLAHASGPIELIGGILLLLGLFTRITAFILSGEMAIAYFTAHLPHAFLPIVNKGEIAVLYCFVFLYLAAAGGGPWSIDALWKRSPK